MGNILSISVSLDGPTICSGLDCMSRHANYGRRLRGNLAALQSACARLTELRNDLNGQVEMADREQVQLPEQVRGWFLRVQNLEAQVGQLIGDVTAELEQKYQGGGCPRNCRTRYKLGKRVAKMLEEVGELMREKRQGVVPERLPPPGVSEMPSEATVGMESKVDEVWSSLHDERVGVVGIYGLGGVGKTTLLIQINNAFTKRTHDFDLVMWATVSRNLNLDKIQDAIWEKIGFCDDYKWKSKDYDGKAKSIWNVLSKRRFVLLLDDIWEWLKLHEVGVPCQNKRNKIVFTTRSEAVCAQMKADRKIKIECLQRDESLNLFRMNVGEDTFNCDPEIPKLARLIARECCGLPLALATIGKTMACKRTTQEWKYAIKVLQSSASKFPGMGDRVLPLLKYSYDSLPSDVAKSCFLYCSLLSEGTDMRKSRMIHYWIYEGILKEFVDMDGAINEGYNIIGTLIHAGLLEQLEDNDDRIKLHDAIRDMALWVACESRRGEDKFLVQTGCGLTEPPKIGEWIGLKRISLINNKIEKLVGAPNCPNLSTLFLSENPLKMISDNFFELMPNLRVLSLYGTHITELPRGIFNLVSLQFLNLSWTRIKELPIELNNLGELKHLVLQRMPESFSIPKQLISSLSKLQVIQIMWFCGTSEGSTLKDGLLSEENEVLVKELESLKYLRELIITITTASAFKRLLSSDKLRSCISHLILMHFNASSSLNITPLSNVECLSILFISGCNFGDLEIDRAWDGKETIESNCLNLKVSFHNLQHVEIRFCPRLKDLSWLPFAPNLKTLYLIKCGQMQEVVDSSKYDESVEDGENLSLFVKLQKLFLDDLPILRSIFWEALPLLNLKKICVFKCPLLKKLPLNAKSGSGRRMVIVGDTKWWNEVVEWEDEATRNAFLPCFEEYVE